MEQDEYIVSNAIMSEVFDWIEMDFLRGKQNRDGYRNFLDAAKGPKKWIKEILKPTKASYKLRVQHAVAKGVCPKISVLTIPANMMKETAKSFRFKVTSNKSDCQCPQSDDGADNESEGDASNSSNASNALVKSSVDLTTEENTVSMRYLLKCYEKSEPMVDGMIMRRFLALTEDFTRGKREFTPPPSSPFKYTPEMIESYKRYELELLNSTGKEDNSGIAESSSNETAESSSMVRSSSESLSELSVISLSSRDTSYVENGPTQASENLMLVFSGGATTSGESGLKPLRKRRNAIDDNDCITPNKFNKLQ